MGESHSARVSLLVRIIQHEIIIKYNHYDHVTTLVMEPIPEVNESEEMYGLVDHFFDALIKYTKECRGVIWNGGEVKTQLYQTDS
ncbi:unnamed protein product [Cuscuta campestris]|uniref:Uncharacterized protein n=1 Tax=Cuscuta campestris TaxID=132261 RepID=A0A484MM90_9ASTE|nr:unnamed protein product [Cuscuta campestris]